MHTKSGICLIAILSCLLSAPFAQAQEAAPAPSEKAASTAASYLKLKDDIKLCAEVKERAIRISCYDNISVGLGYMEHETAIKEKETLQTIGFWEVSQSVTTFGEKRTTLRAESTNYIKSSSGTDRHVHFVIQCTPGKTEAFLDWKTPVTKPSQTVMKHGIDVAYRIDSNDKIAEKWQVSTDRLAVFVPDAVEFVRSMNNKNKLSFEIVPLGDSVQGVHFDIKGIEKAAEELAKACY